MVRYSGGRFTLTAGSTLLGSEVFKRYFTFIIIKIVQLIFLSKLDDRVSGFDTESKITQTVLVGFHELYRFMVRETDRGDASESVRKKDEVKM